MKNSKRKAIHQYYAPRMREDAADHEILGWESRKDHLERFEVIAELLPLEGSRILDVGCGLGNLLEFMKEQSIVPARYVGVDLLDCMVKAAGERHPEGDFRCLDLFEDTDFASQNRRQFDVIVASGIFNLYLGNNREFMIKALCAFADLEPAYIIFNFLDSSLASEGPRYWTVSATEIEEILEHIPGIAGKPVRMIRNRPAGDSAVRIALSGR